MGLSFLDTDLHGFMVAMGDWLIHSRAGHTFVFVEHGPKYLIV